MYLLTFTSTGTYVCICPSVSPAFFFQNFHVICNTVSDKRFNSPQFLIMMFFSKLIIEISESFVKYAVNLALEKSNLKLHLADNFYDHKSQTFINFLLLCAFSSTEYGQSFHVFLCCLSDYDLCQYWSTVGSGGVPPPPRLLEHCGANELLP